MSFNEYYYSQNHSQQHIDKGKILVKKQNKSTLFFLERLYHEKVKAHCLFKENPKWHSESCYLYDNSYIVDVDNSVLDVNVARQLWVDLVNDGWIHLDEQVR